MIGKKKFENDLKFGNEYEKRYIEYKNFQNYNQPKGYFKEYDIICYDEEEKGIKYEVKTDRRANETGNICIEYLCSGKDSGIRTTTANIYVYIILKNEGYDIYEIPTKKIRKYIKKEKYTKIRNTDNGKSEFYLFSINTFSKYKIN